MSNDFRKPTYDFHGGAYNATEVRLYGIPSLDSNVSLDGKQYNLRVTLEEAESPRAAASGSTAGAGASSSRRSRQNPNLEVKIRSVLALDSRDFSPNFIFLASGVVAEDGRLPEKVPFLSSGVIFGYSFEGHCYDLPKPQPMLLPVPPRSIPSDDCGYDAKAKEGYAVWVVDRLDKCVEFEVSQGFIEQLVLEANTPGRRSPSTYRATMALAHRSGRLSE